jgi:hypothetical protein
VEDCVDAIEWNGSRIPDVLFKYNELGVLCQMVPKPLSVDHDHLVAIKEETFSENRADVPAATRHKESHHCLCS